MPLVPYTRSKSQALICFHSLRIVGFNAITDGRQTTIASVARGQQRRYIVLK